MSLSPPPATRRGGWRPVSSLRKAINAKCRECLYDADAVGLGPWRMQVEACTSPECPLFEVRPRNRCRKVNGRTVKADPSTENVRTAGGA